MLQECEIHFEIVQDFDSGAGNADRNVLGRVRLNLAEYVDKSDAGGEEGEEDEGVVRRYLMQDSKINSTLRVGVLMKLVEGERTFIT